jgi:hypothetical protein
VQTQLPVPQPPFLTSVLSAPIFPTNGNRVMQCPHCKQSLTAQVPVDKSEPLKWVLNEKHPIFEDLLVIRMYLVEDRGGVEVYSVTHDRRSGIRHFIPNESILLTEEGMPMPVFIEELVDAEGLGDEPDDPESPEPLPAPAPNGQPAS